MDVFQIGSAMNEEDLQARGVNLVYAPPWASAAATVLHAARNGHWTTAAVVLGRIVADYGSGAVVEVMAAWIDTFAHVCGITEQGEIGPAFFDTDMGVDMGIDDVPRDVAWAGRLVAARLNGDEPTFEALIDAVPNDATWMECVNRVLSLVASGINAHLGLELEDGQDHETTNGANE